MIPITARYRLLHTLGEGGMGVVWEAESLATGQRFAIKVLREQVCNPELEKRFLREAEAANAVAHPGILRVHETLHDPAGMPAFVMDLLDGESLAARLDREKRLGVGQTAAILLPVISAVRAAHAAGVVHRDLKPDNVFLTREPRGAVGVRVLDFGIARLVQPTEKLTVTGTLMGTPLYMSPEQAAGESVDPRTDHWSLAALAFECLTGATVVQGANYGQILSNLIRFKLNTFASVGIALPSDVTAALDALLVERDQRPDLGALEAALSRHADAVIVPPAVVVAPAPRRHGHGETLLDASSVTPWAPSNRRVAAIAAVLAMMVVVGLAAGTVALVARARRPMTTAAPFPSWSGPDPSLVAPSATMTVAPLPSARPVATPSSTLAPNPSASESAKRPERVRLQGGVAGGAAPF